MAAPLTFEFIGNACGIFTGKLGTKILCDPWIENGVFEGSWCHYPPLKTKVDDLMNVDAIFVSHLHPDHFDERFFDFDKSMPLIVLDHRPNFLIRKLELLGYKNLVKIKDGQTVQFMEFELTCFAPFAKHNFHEADVGNLLDSALLVACDGVSAFNANDNTPTIESAKKLAEEFGPIDLAMLNYNAAGPYPSCFDNLSSAEKLREHKRILTRNFDHVCDILKAMKSRCFLPFAGAYVLGGREAHKNAFLGTSTWDECADYVRGQNIPLKVITLREHDVFDIDAEKSNKPYVPVDTKHMQFYIENELKQILYPYEADILPEEAALKDELMNASSLMKERMERFGIRSQVAVVIELFGANVQIYPEFSEAELPESQAYLQCQMDERLLNRILHRKAHWNNAEIGAHINFVRAPNNYEPDLHMGLQFLHL